MAPEMRKRGCAEKSPVLGRLGHSTIRNTAAVLATGGIAVLPTDTIYGFHCAASKSRAIARILELKGARRREGFILLAADAAMAGRIVERWPGASRETLRRIWPAPLTAILPARGMLSPLLAPGGRVAVRVPALAELRNLIAALGEPLVSTSVNRSGGEPMTSIVAIRAAFPGLGGYLSRWGRSSPRSSTIVDFSARDPMLVRAGRYPWPAAG